MRPKTRRDSIQLDTWVLKLAESCHDSKWLLVRFTDRNIFATSSKKYWDGSFTLTHFSSGVFISLSLSRHFCLLLQAWENWCHWVQWGKPSAGHHRVQVSLRMYITVMYTSSETRYLCLWMSAALLNTWSRTCGHDGYVPHPLFISSSSPV